jgi:hypothetical protein
MWNENSLCTFVWMRCYLLVKSGTREVSCITCLESTAYLFCDISKWGIHQNKWGEDLKQFIIKQKLNKYLKQLYNTMILKKSIANQI